MDNSIPFKSKAQEKWMWANKPEMAQRWEEEHKKSGKSKSELPERLRPKKKFSKLDKLIKRR